MDFFDRQDQTRRVSRWLVLLFIAAVIAIVAATTLLVLFALGQPQNPRVGLLSASNLGAQASLLATTAIGVTAAMLLASVYRSMSLRGGGGKIAREVGGQRLDADTRDPQLQQLQNVVEEIALAAGVPVPEIYVLEEEDGINAFAAGYSPADAAIAVTRGTLDKLDRAELQGVIAHEFSHILNGDMRLNIRLIGVIFGILVLSIIGQRVMYGAALTGGSRRNNNGGAIIAIGLGLVAIGYIGLFFGRWIKSAVARQRESLADASAVQFTRHPEGIAGALKKIAVYSEGAHLQAETEEVNHMLFGEASARRLFATHPPIMDRIRAIEPDFDQQQLQALAARLASSAQDPASSSGPQPQPARAGRSGGFDIQGLIDSIGRVDQHTLAAAAAISESLPKPLLHAARHVESAPALVSLLLVGRDPDTLATQLRAIRNTLGEPASERVQALIRDHGLPAREQKLALLDAALPALKRRASARLEQFTHLVDTLSEADNQIDAFEFMLGQIMRNYLRDAANPGQREGRADFNQRRGAVATTLAVLAHFGNVDDRAAAQAAYAAGDAVMRTDMSAAWPDAPDWPQQLRNALETLDGLAPQAKRTLVRAWSTAVLHDRETRPAEIELLRAFCVSIHVPMPAMR